MNCKPGDLAIITASDYPADIGMVVEVLGDTIDPWVDLHLPEWRCRSDRISVVWDADAGEDRLSLEFDIPDAWLRPISGVPINDTVTDDLEVTA